MGHFSPPPMMIGVMPASLSFFTAARKSSQVLIGVRVDAGLGDELLVVEEDDLG